MHFELCLALGIPHPDYLHQYLTASQIREWEVFSSIYPLGTFADDFRMSYMLSVITNLFIDTYGKEGAKHVDWDKFMPDWEQTKQEPPAMRPFQIKQIFRRLKRNHKKAKEQKNKRIRKRM